MSFGSRYSLRRQFIIALIISSLSSIGLFAYRSWRAGGFIDGYLLLNLLLAWLPLIFAFRLVVVLRKKLWSSWEAMGLSLLWLIFLPNSFYMISDFIHLQGASSSIVLYDTVMFSSFIYTALLLGYISLFPVHLELRRRFSARTSAGCLGLIILIISVAIYLGRDLRWNSWNVVTNPGGLLFDLSNQLLHPAAYPQMILTTVTFFIFISATYNVVWRAARVLARGPAR